MMQKKIKVLIVEDSPVSRMVLEEILNGDPRIAVLGTVASGEAAQAFLANSKPDVVLMDIHMPGLDGYETTRLIMESQPLPIVICSATCDTADVANTFHALDAGAVAFVAKPVGPGHQDFVGATAKLLETVTLMSEVRVVKRWPRARGRREAQALIAGSPAREATQFRVVAIGTSTGGPPALQTILSGLPRNFPVPILIVQHIAAGFLSGLVDWLTQTTGFPARIAEHDERAVPGQAYLAPDGYHMGVTAEGRILLSKQPAENGLRPAVSFLFRSVGAACGRNAMAVLLTGMGKDGADELKALKDLGATTLAQDAESSVIHGMPGEAIRLGAAIHVMPPDRIASALVGWASANSRSPWTPPDR